MCLSSLETTRLPKAISLCTLCDGKLSDINSCDTPLNTTWTILFPSPAPFRCCQLPFCERYIGNQHCQGCGKATSGQTNIDFCLNLLIYLFIIVDVQRFPSLFILLFLSTAGLKLCCHCWVTC